MRVETSSHRLRGNPEVGGIKYSKPASRVNLIINLMRAGGLYGDRCRPRRECCSVKQAPEDFGPEGGKLVGVGGGRTSLLRMWERALERRTRARRMVHCFSGWCASGGAERKPQERVRHEIGLEGCGSRKPSRE